MDVRLKSTPILRLGLMNRPHMGKLTDRHLAEIVGQLTPCLWGQLAGKRYLEMTGNDPS